jgi:hypothetical protein
MSLIVRASQRCSVTVVTASRMVMVRMVMVAGLAPCAAGVKGNAGSAMAAGTASADALLDRMLDKIDALCAERDRLKKEARRGPKAKLCSQTDSG